MGRALVRPDVANRRPIVVPVEGPAPTSLVHARASDAEALRGLINRLESAVYRCVLCDLGELRPGL